jgi:predicted amidohydrolase YtcJ
MDPGWPSATAVAVRDKKILSVGSLEDINPWLENNGYEIIETFKEKIFMPSFIEPHSHPIRGGLLLSLPLLSFFDQPSPYGASFKALKTKSQALARLEEYDRNLADPQQALVAWGYDKVALGEPLTVQDSDRISSSRPILVWDASEKSKGVKFFCDDAFLALSMQMTNPGYTDGHSGLWNTIPGNEFHNLVHRWWEEGFHIHIHTNGNAAQEATINLLSSLQKNKPRFDHRFTFEHFGMSTADQIRRLKELGAVVGVNPYYIHHRGEINAHHIGTDRAYKAARMETLLQVGVTTTMHSDTPVGPPVPLEWVWIAVNRA